MMSDKAKAAPKPARVTGIRHLFAATGYSLSGVRRLWAEAAFRHEVLGGAMAFALLIALRIPPRDIAVFAVLYLILIAAEALNTAIEEVVDHLAPQWAQFAKHAKDLGSLAVFCLLCANGIYLAAIILPVVF